MRRTKNGTGDPAVQPGQHGTHRRRLWPRIALITALAGVVTGDALVFGGTGRRDAIAPPGGGAAFERMAAEDLDGGIRALRAHLATQPKDATGWAALGVAYVEQARANGDPSRYPRAERALERSLRLRPDGNDAALAGLAAVAAARHDFRRALTYADRALAVNGYSERALSLRVDALVELGRYDAAMRAAERADARSPGVPVSTRFAYVLELHGDTAGARRVLTRALAGARTPGDISYVANELGQLARSQGQYGAALRHFARALAADPGNTTALEGRGLTRSARGDAAGARRDLEEAVHRLPVPGALVALGDLYESMGLDERANRQYERAEDWSAGARAAGENTDLETALLEADHGSPARALAAARDEWDRRHSVHTADALAWALHAAGQDAEALRYARQSSAPGYRNAQFRYHRGVIERAVGDDRAARRSLTAALELSPGFSPRDAPAARAVLSQRAPTGRG